MSLLVSWQIASIAQTELPEKEDSTYQQNFNLYDFNPSRRWVRDLKNIIIVSPKNESDTINVQSLDGIYRESVGMTISEIRILRLKPFGASVTDSSYRHITWVGRAGNALHVNTADFVIRNALLFKKGDKVDAVKLAYSERYLRSLGYIGDARVSVVPVSENEVEVIVVVQDILPYSASFETNFETQANFSVTNNNIIGLGIELQAGVFINSEKEDIMGYRAMLRSSNIGRSLISFQADYLDRYERQRYGFALRRDFHTPATKYAGHLMLYDARTPVRYFNYKGETPPTTPILIRYNQLDVWLGRSFQLNRASLNEQAKNITVSLGAQRMHFIDSPEDSEQRYYRFQDRTTYLASLTYSQQSFYNSSLIYNYGLTEDIPYGYLFSIIGGKEMNVINDRPYIGAISSSGYSIPGMGYLSGAVSYGTFFNKRTAVQGVIDVDVCYFSNLYSTGNMRQRTYANGRYTRQLFNPWEDRLIIEGEHGIPGFRNDSVLGRHRLNISLEQNVFMPREVYGFRFVFYAFSYLSWLGDYKDTIILSNLYSSFGLGVRLRNNRLIFNTLQVQLAYFPNIPKNSRFRYIYISSEKVLKPRDFMPKTPEVMPLY